VIVLGQNGGLLGDDSLDDLREFDSDSDGRLTMAEFKNGFLPSWNDEPDWSDVAKHTDHMRESQPKGAAREQSFVELQSELSKSLKPEPHVLAKYGVPYPWEEKCVLCQYLVHRAKLRLYDKVIKSDTGAPPKSDGGLTAPDQQAIVPAMQMKDVLAKVAFLPTGRQMARSAAEDALQWFCHPTRIPIIYLDFCIEFSAKLPMLIEPVFFGMPDAQACSEIRTCYLRLIGGHDWFVSSIVNGFRRKCGFLGGPRGDKTSFFKKIKCFLLSKLWQMIDIQISNGGSQK